MAGYKYAIKRAFPYTIPVLTGYLFIGIAFGVMFAEKGYSFLWAILMSLMVYAGSGQYLAVNFFAPGVSFLHVIFMTLMVNIRHVFYGISLLERFHSMGKKRWYMIFGLTDETYSLLCTTKVPSGVEEEKFLFVINNPCSHPSETKVGNYMDRTPPLSNLFMSFNSSFSEILELPHTAVFFRPICQ